MFYSMISDEMRLAFEFFFNTFGELAVLFLVISFVVSFVNQKLPASKIKRMLSGTRGYGVALGLGAVTPFCSCSTLPMTIGLIKARAPFGPIMTFLFTSPLLNPFIAGLFWVTFGAKITLVYAGFVIALSVCSGWLLQYFEFDRYIREELLVPTCDRNKTEGNDATSASRCSGNQTVNMHKVRWPDLAKESLSQFMSFVPYMVLGVAVGAIINGYVPVTFFEQLSRGSVFWVIPAAAMVGVMLYVRASTMVPIAASLAAKGMSMGAIMSLTIGGAGASLPEMIMMKKMFHWPLLLAFITLVFSTACLTGFVIELL
jgi:uncharacterized membrane protein YraQ (UPF0718 family)